MERASSRIEEEIDSALASLGVPDDHFAKCESHDAKLVIERFRSRFVAGHPSLWWTALKQPHVVIPFPNGDGHLHLAEHVPPGDRECWFIAEQSGGQYPVYKANLQSIAPVLSQCFYFVYYLVGLDFRWLVLENDHNEIISSRAKDTS